MITTRRFSEAIGVGGGEPMASLNQIRALAYGGRVDIAWCVGRSVGGVAQEYATELWSRGRIARPLATEHNGNGNGYGYGNGAGYGYGDGDGYGYGNGAGYGAGYGDGDGDGYGDGDAQRLKGGGEMEIGKVAVIVATHGFRDYIWAGVVEEIGAFVALANAHNVRQYTGGGLATATCLDPSKATLDKATGPGVVRVRFDAVICVLDVDQVAWRKALGLEQETTR